MIILKKAAHAAAVLLCAFIVITGAARAQADPAVYGALPSIDEADISPDGKTLALLETVNGLTIVGIYPLDGGTSRPVSLGKLKARGIQWAGNEYLLLLVSDTDRIETSAGMRNYEVWRYVSISRDGEDIKYMFSGGGIFSATTTPGDLLHTLPDDPEHALIAHLNDTQRNTVRMSNIQNNDENYRRGWSVYKVNLRTGRQEKIVTGTEETADFIVDRNGEAVLRIDYDEGAEKRLVRRIEGRRKVTTIAEFDEPVGATPEYGFATLSDDGKMLYAFGYHGKNTRGVYGLNLETGEIDTTVFHTPEYDVDRLLLNPATASVIGAAYTKHFPERVYFDKEFEALQSALVNALKPDSLSVTSMSQDRKTAVVRANFSDQPSKYYLFDKSAGELSLLGSTYPAVESAPKLKRAPYDYTASDGVRIPGYLTMPPGGGRNLPLIVLPHGGPEARDTQAFDWWAAFYAQRGYAVYQPNFRGSNGYGYQFRSSGYGEWGRKMQSDITEGVQKLIAEGVVDGNRMCIVGASYGGYAALAGATLTPNLYKCAVSVNGVADLVSMLGAEAEQSEYSVAYWEQRIGSRFRDRSEIEAVSPVHQVGRITRPVMIIHGTADTVVPYAQAERMWRALQDAGKTFEFVEMKDEDHWLSTGEMRTEMLRRSIEFIDKHIGG